MASNWLTVCIWVLVWVVITAWVIENGCIDVEDVEDDAVVDAVATAAPAVTVVAGTGAGADGTAIATTINTHSYNWNDNFIPEKPNFDINLIENIRQYFSPAVVAAVTLSLAMLFCWSYLFAGSKFGELFNVIGFVLPRVSIEIKLSQMTESPTLYGFTIDEIEFTHFNRELSYNFFAFFFWLF